MEVLSSIVSNTTHHHFVTGDYAFFLFNILIIGGYLAAAYTFAFAKFVLPVMLQIFSPLTRYLAANFFVVASITRGQLAWHTVTQTPYLNLTTAKSVPLDVNCLHLYQAVSIWVFLAAAAYDLTTLRSKDDS